MAAHAAYRMVLRDVEESADMSPPIPLREEYLKHCSWGRHRDIGGPPRKSHQALHAPFDERGRRDKIEDWVLDDRGPGGTLPPADDIRARSNARFPSEVRVMKLFPVLAVSLLAVGGLVACASKSEPEQEQDKGLEGDGVGSADSAPDTNPAGVPYPTENIGTIERKGDKPGNRIKNFKFLGYPDGNVAGGLQPISLAQYFDPTGEKYQIIHIQAAGVWCSACQGETRAVVPLKEQLEAKKAVWLVSLAEGPTAGVPSKQKDLDGWIKRFESPYTHWLDPGNANLGPFYDRTALPWNADIDARTMEILTSGTGGAPSGEYVLQEIDKALALAAKSTLVGSPQ